MPSHLFADRAAAQPPGRGPVDALISQTRRLRGDVDAVRRGTAADASDPKDRWQRALYDLALHQLNDLDEHLAQLRDGPLPVPAPAGSGPAAPPRPDSPLSRVGSAEWNLLTDEASWSGELYRILDRDPAAPPLTLDELPSLVHDEDRPKLTAMVTGCLVDARPIDGEFRLLRPDGSVRTVHMTGEPVLGADGSTASMWAVLRDVSELRRCRRAVSETRESLHHQQAAARTGQRSGTEPPEAVPPPWHGSLPLARQGPRTLDLAARHLPSPAGAPSGGAWYDTLELSDGTALLSVGELTGQGAGPSPGTTMLLGAMRGMAMAGTAPGRLLACLDRLLDATGQPALGSGLCLYYRPDTRSLVWARAGRPVPLLFRDGRGRALEIPATPETLETPGGDRPGASPAARYGQAEETLEVGDVLVLHTAGPASGRAGAAAVRHLLGLAPQFSGDRTARDCLPAVLRELGGTAREEEACVLVARVTS
ncbi:PP2C family protein-serine/threonine phosphatase [Streptomyces sp. NPDC055186]